MVLLVRVKIMCLVLMPLPPDDIVPNPSLESPGVLRTNVGIGVEWWGPDGIGKEDGGLLGCRTIVQDDECRGAWDGGAYPQTPKKDEAFVLLRGKVCVIIHNDDGLLKEVISLCSEEVALMIAE